MFSNKRRPSTTSCREKTEAGPPPQCRTTPLPLEAPPPCPRPTTTDPPRSVRRPATSGTGPSPPSARLVVHGVRDRNPLPTSESSTASCVETNARLIRVMTCAWESDEPLPRTVPTIIGRSFKSGRLTSPHVLTLERWPQLSRVAQPEPLFPHKRRRGGTGAAPCRGAA